MGSKKKNARDEFRRWPEHNHELIHTFGVKDYDAYWNAAPMRNRMRPILKRLSRELKKLIAPPAKLLELGPGAGHLFKHLSQAGYEMYACDASQVSLNQLNAPAERLKLADLNKGLPNFGIKFKAILSSMVLHHIDKPDSFLQTLRNTLDSDGYLVITIPNIVTAQNRLRMLAGKFPRLSPSHRNFMTPDEVKKLITQNRLKVVHTFSARRKPLQAIAPTLFSKELLLIAQPV